MSDIYGFEVADARGERVPLGRYAGRVLLMVNTASRCGFTPQYAELEAIHRELEPRGLSVLAFPCNQFGAQEPGGAAEIASFCTTAYGVTFPVFAKLDVNGSNADPLYAFLTAARPGFLGIRRVTWNFTKFLVGRDGKVVARAGPRTRPGRLRPLIGRLLGPPPAES